MEEPCPAVKHQQGMLSACSESWLRVALPAAEPSLPQTTLLPALLLPASLDQCVAASSQLLSRVQHVSVQLSLLEVWPAYRCAQALAA